MNLKAISSHFSEAVLAFLKEEVEDRGQSALAEIEAQYAADLTTLGELLMQLTVQTLKGEDVSFLAGNINATVLNIASGSQALSVRQINEFLEDSAEVAKALIITALRLA